MQNFVLAGGTLNGDSEVWIDDASATVLIQTSGEGMRGATGSGAASVVMLGDLTLAMQARFSGAASVVTQVTGAVLYGATMSGLASAVCSASGDFTRWVMIESDAPVDVYADGDIVAVEAISSTFDIVLDAVCDLAVAEGWKIEGAAPIEVVGDFAGWVGASSRLSGSAQIEAAGIGSMGLRITSPDGSAFIRVSADGSARLGAKHSLSGSATIGSYAAGRLSSWRYVFGTGDAAMRIFAAAASAGIPSFPDHYIAAPSIRSLRVNEDRRDFTVPADRRI